MFVCGLEGVCGCSCYEVVVVICCVMCVVYVLGVVVDVFSIILLNGCVV